jgi:endo-1,4-beta-xylanase
MTGSAAPVAGQVPGSLRSPSRHGPPRIGRRAFLADAAGLALAAAMPAARAEAPSLAALAARSGRFFGAALTSRDATGDGPVAGLFDAECSVWVPEWELKWGALARRAADPPDFRAVDALVAAARRRDKRLRGHTLLWHENLPAGIDDTATRADWDRHVVGHVTGVAARYRDAIFQWDVVNEAIEPAHGLADGMRLSPFQRMLGSGWVGEAFRLARAAAPEAKLYLNDYGVCYADARQERRRDALLRLVEGLRRDGVPIDGFGIQGHLDTRLRFDEGVFRRFLDTLEGFGIEIAITELDVREADAAGGRDLAARRLRAAEEVRRVLSVALDSRALTGVVTWGLTDRESWLRKTRPIPDNQGLPWDDTLKPTPMRETLAASFAAARKRHD